MHYYVFITTNLINEKQYIGDHSTNNLNDNYLGSRKAALIPAFKKYGKENFKREILEFFSTKQEAFNAQEKYIIQYNTLSPNGYNISPKGGHGCKDCWGEESKQKSSKSMKGKNTKKHTPEHNKKMSESMKGKNTRKHTIEENQKVSRTLTGRKQSQETINKRIKSLRGKKRSEQSRKNISLGCIGRIVSTETRQKISNTLSGKKVICPFCNKEGGISIMHRYHFDNCKNKNKND
jgi:group I intron endonuclease